MATLRRPPLDSVRETPVQKRRSPEMKSFINGVVEDKNTLLDSISSFCFSFFSFLHENMWITSIMYFLIVTASSYTVDEYGPVPASYFSNKQNHFNQYFVKLGWAWTLCLVGLFLFVASYIRLGGHLISVLLHMTRLIAGTVLWYVFTEIFVNVHQRVGFCEGQITTNLKTCKRPHRIDISGHCFLLLFSILVLLEESKLFRNWNSIPSQCERSPMRRGNVPSAPHNVHSLHFHYSHVVQFLLILIFIFFIFCHVMIISTILYFHDTLQKSLGSLFAVFSWILLYKIFPLILPISNENFKF